MSYQATHSTDGAIADKRKTSKHAADDCAQYVDLHAPTLAGELLAMSQHDEIPENAYYWHVTAIAESDDPQNMALHQARLMLWQYVKVVPI